MENNKKYRGRKITFLKCMECEKTIDKCKCEEEFNKMFGLGMIFAYLSMILLKMIIK